MRKINLRYYKLRYRNISLFYWYKGGDLLNYFFKFLLPQLSEYFKDDKSVKDFIPKVLLEYTKENERNVVKDETINK